MKTRYSSLPALLLATSLWLPSLSQALQLDDRLTGLEATAIRTETTEEVFWEERETDLEPLPSPAAIEPTRGAITHFLRANLGEPYRFGATGGRQGFDCSGLVLRAYEAAGLKVPRVSVDQLRAGAPVALDALKAGDLLFYRMLPNAPQRLHVVVYVGEGRAIHASVKHQKVREIDITRGVWARQLIAARTLL